MYDGYVKNNKMIFGKTFFQVLKKMQGYFSYLMAKIFFTFINFYNKV